MATPSTAPFVTTTSFHPAIPKPPSASLEEVDEHTCRTEEMSDGSQASETSVGDDTIEALVEREVQEKEIQQAERGDDVVEEKKEDGESDQQQQQEEEEDSPEQDYGVPCEIPMVRRGSLKRTTSEPLHIIEKKSVWKCLPPPSREILQRAVSEPIEAPSRRAQGSSVKFDRVLVRSYTQTVGDNPSVSYGPPISLDWDYEEHDAVNIDEWEFNHPPRRTLRQMVLSYYQRRNVLSWQYGVSEEELRAAKKETKKIKFQRSITQTLLPALHLEAAVESAARKTKRFLKGRKQKERSP